MLRTGATGVIGNCGRPKIRIIIIRPILNLHPNPFCSDEQQDYVLTHVHLDLCVYGRRVKPRRTVKSGCQRRWTIVQYGDVER